MSVPDEDCPQTHHAHLSAISTYLLLKCRLFVRIRPSEH